jgi:hypothetical protein
VVKVYYDYASFKTPIGEFSKANIARLLSLLLAGRGSAISSINSRSDTHNSLMDGGLNAVVLLNVQLGQSVVLEGGGIADISQSRSINHVSNIIYMHYICIV